MFTLTAKINLLVFMSIEVDKLKGDVFSVNFVSVVIEGVE